jgi:hypothetical protein
MPDVLEERLTEFKKILNDPIYFAEKYFYIISLDGGKQLIKIYEKQAELIRGMCDYQRLICLSCRQARKIYCIYSVCTMVCPWK